VRKRQAESGVRLGSGSFGKRTAARLPAAAGATAAVGAAATATAAASAASPRLMPQRTLQQQQQQQHQHLQHLQQQQQEQQAALNAIQRQREDAARRENELRIREAQLNEQSQRLATMELQAQRRTSEYALPQHVRQQALRSSAGEVQQVHQAHQQAQQQQQQQVYAQTSQLARQASGLESSGEHAFSSYDDIPVYDNFDQINAAVAQLVENENSDSPYLPSDETSPEYEDEDFGIIGDPQGRQFWKQMCGLRATIVDWQTFFAALQRQCPDPIDARLLQNILDYSRTGFVSQYKFSEFLKAFGPLAQCLRNVNALLSKAWFHGFLSSKECELLLDAAPKGTFLVRFSKSTTGSFALAYKCKDGPSSPQTMQHILITASLPEGFKIREGRSAFKVFESLDAIVAHYAFVLKIAFASRITEQPWFQGDLNAAETNELLLDKPVGTFLVRFSSAKPGALALSFVDKDGAIRHARIMNQSDGRFFVENEQQKATFVSVSTLIEYYQRAGSLSQPYN
jgi:hypothetical protein